MRLLGSLHPDQSIPTFAPARPIDGRIPGKMLSQRNRSEFELISRIFELSFPPLGIQNHLFPRPFPGELGIKVVGTPSG